MALPAGIARSGDVSERGSGSRSSMHYGKCSEAALAAILRIELTRDVLDYVKEAIGYFDQPRPKSGQKWLAKPDDCKTVTGAFKSLFLEYQQCIRKNPTETEPRLVDLGWASKRSSKAKNTIRANFACIDPHGVGEILKGFGFHDGIMSPDEKEEQSS